MSHGWELFAIPRCPDRGEPCILVSLDVCGNGIVEPKLGEECDDGINDGGYGECNPGCQLAPYCGDGIVQPEIGEECDDGNADSDDGCSPTCVSVDYPLP